MKSLTPPISLSVLLAGIALTGLTVLPNLNSISYCDGPALPEIKTMADLGVIKDSTVTLGPGQTKSVDLSSKISGRFSATSRSADVSIAGVSAPNADRNNREHITSIITAGENETEEVKTTTVTYTVTREVINVEIPEQEPGARVNTAPQADRVQTMTITVHVLPKKRYEAMQEAARLAADRAAKDRAARAAARPNPNNRRINLCVGEQRLYSMDNEVRNTPERNKPAGNPVQMRGVQVTRNTNPASVGAQAFAGFGANGEQTADPVKLQIVGNAVGESTLTVEENPAPLGPPGVGIAPWRQVFDVSVKECPGKKPRVAAIPDGYRVLVIPAPRVASDLEEDDWLDDAPGTGTTQPGESSTTPDGNKSASGAPKEMKMMMGSGLKTYHAALPSPDGVPHEMTVNCPEDAAAGDVITCSVYTDSTDSNYQLELESTHVFFDTPHGPGPQTFTATMPKDKSATAIVLRDMNGEVVLKSMLALMPAQPMSDKAQIFFPRQAHTNGPMQFKGCFPESASKTAVEVNGESAPILAKSPRTLIAQNPTNTVGEQQVVVKEGTVVQRGMVETLPPHVALNTGSPLMAMPSPIEKTAVDGACQELVSTYKQNLRSEVDRNWHPPKPYSKGTWVTLLKYDLTKDNRVVNINVVKPSGDPRLDQAAVSRVYQLQGQFKPIPQCYQQDRLPIDHTFKIIYR